jgi:hypothetical protein
MMASPAFSAIMIIVVFVLPEATADMIARPSKDQPAGINLASLA